MHVLGRGRLVRRPGWPGAPRPGHKCKARLDNLGMPFTLTFSDRKHSAQGTSELLGHGPGEGSECRVDPEAEADHVGT